MADIICGVDIGAKALDARIDRNGAWQQLERTEAGIAELASFCKQHQVGLVVMSGRRRGGRHGRRRRSWRCCRGCGMRWRAWGATGCGLAGGKVPAGRCLRLRAVDAEGSELAEGRQLLGREWGHASAGDRGDPPVIPSDGNRSPR